MDRRPRDHKPVWRNVGPGKELCAILTDRMAEYNDLSVPEDKIKELRMGNQKMVWHENEPRELTTSGAI